jgi:hypothetical protein
VFLNGLLEIFLLAAAIVHPTQARRKGGFARQSERADLVPGV